MDNTTITPYEHLVMANLMLAARHTGMVRFTYVNWRGESREREVRMDRFYYGRTEWHNEECILLTATDLGKNAVRHFSIKHIAIASIKSY